MDVQKLGGQLRDFLLSSDVKEYIVKIILFGSQAKKTALPHSDIDLLIVTADGKGQERSVMDLMYDFMIDFNVPLEVMTAHINEMVVVQDYFMYNILHYGVEIYSMEKQAIKNLMIKNLLQLCEEYLDSAKAVLAIKRLRLAIDAAYNAAELAAKALILLKQDDLPGSHGGVVSLLGQLYIKTNELEKEIGRTLNMALKLRNEARYRPDAVLSQENAQLVLELAEQLINFAANKMSAL